MNIMKFKVVEKILKKENEEADKVAVRITEILSEKGI